MSVTGIQHRTTTTLHITKQRIERAEQRMSLKAMLMELFPEAFTGQVVIHFNARNPVIAEWQERTDTPTSQKGVDRTPFLV